MVIKKFPPVDTADEYGVVGIGGDFEVETLVNAYRSGIFPWPVDNFPYVWFAPDPRAILELNEFHISASLRKAAKKSSLVLKMNSDFGEIITLCSKSHTGGKRGKTWITKELIQGYVALHKQGYAYNVGAYDGSEIVGGIYGVIIGGFVSAESMFYLKPNASKLALMHLVEHLKAMGIKWIDLQALNPFTKSIGGKEISREEFMLLLKASLKKRAKIFPD